MAGRFQKGQSGNPGGRPKACWALAKLIHEQTHNGADIVAFVVRVFKGEAGSELADGKSRRWAADWLSDRGFGKPQQVIEISTGEELRPINYDALSDEQLEALAMLDAANATPAKVLRLVPQSGETPTTGEDRGEDNEMCNSSRDGGASAG